MKLKDYLESKKKSGLAFSKETGINQKAIDRITREVGGITLRTAKKIVQATSGEVTMWDLPTGEEDKVG